VEVDGSGHLDQENYDQKRDETLEGLGLQMLRFYNTDVIEDIDTVLEVILEYCQRGKKTKAFHKSE
jgi:very-short-patch-repair endonuclease